MVAVGLPGDAVRADVGLLAAGTSRQTQVQRHRQDDRQVATVSRAALARRCAVAVGMRRRR